jgi:hypothetical protein
MRAAIPLLIVLRGVGAGLHAAGESSGKPRGAADPVRTQDACRAGDQVPGLSHYQSTWRSGGLSCCQHLRGLPREHQEGQPAIQKLADYAAKQTPVPWARVYKLPRQVYFSHEIHHRKAKVECAVCHGPVAEREALVQEKSIR